MDFPRNLPLEPNVMRRQEYHLSDIQICHYCYLSHYLHLQRNFLYMNLHVLLHYQSLAHAVLHFDNHKTRRHSYVVWHFRYGFHRSYPE